MRKLLLIPAAVAMMASCSNNNDVDLSKYEDWRDENTQWINTLATKKNDDGTPMYTTIRPGWDPSTYILKRQIGDTHPQNLTPLYTSTTTVNYEVHLSNDSLIDKGTNFNSTLNSQGLIPGWAIAQMTMNVGDSCEFILPYDVAYGEYGTGNVPPYSALRFNIHLVDIPAYEIRP